MNQFICEECATETGKTISDGALKSKCTCDVCGKVKICYNVTDEVTITGGELMQTESQQVSTAHDFNIETAIGQAIQKGLPVETMKELLAMRKELKDEYAKEQFFISLAKFQSECPVIEKKKEAGSGNFKYKYAPLESIIKQVGKHLINNGFSYTFDTEEIDGKIISICYAHHTATHTKSATVKVPVDSGRMNSIQQVGSSISYGSRYAFQNAFGIRTGDEDNDGNVGDEKKSPAKTEKKSPAKTEKKPQPKKIDIYGNNIKIIATFDDVAKDDMSDKAKSYRKEIHAHFCELSGMCDSTENVQTGKRTVIAPELNKISDKLFDKLIELSNDNIKKFEEGTK